MQFDKLDDMEKNKEQDDRFEKMMDEIEDHPDSNMNTARKIESEAVSMHKERTPTTLIIPDKKQKDLDMFFENISPSKVS